MKIEIHARNIHLDESLRTEIERRIGQAIGRFDEFIRCVVVHLANRNGTGATMQKHCRISVSLNSSDEVEIEESDVDVNAITTRATSRLGLAIFGELWRQRESTRRGYRSREE